jgi:hypothetical protein
MLNSSSPRRRIHWFRYFAATLYLVIVATLAVVPILNPDGLVTESASLVLTSPTSFFFLLWTDFSAPHADTILILLAGLVNAIILFVLSVVMVSRFGFKRTTGIFVLSTSLYGAVAWWFNDQDQMGRVRIVNGGPNVAGVWIATNDDGLRVMSNQPLVPPSLFGLQSAIRANPANDKLVFVPNKTRGITKGRQFLLKGGRLVEPYSTNTYAMLRDGVVAVERIKITEGPQTGLVGWLPTHLLQRLATIASL